MTGHLQDSVQAKLSHLDEQIQQRDLRVTLGYSLGLAGSIALYLYFPFPMSRIGSVVLMVALAWGLAAFLTAFLLDGRLVCGTLGAENATKASRLNERTGIVVAKQIRIVMSQSSYQFYMEVIHHVGTMGEI